MITQFNNENSGGFEMKFKNIMLTIFLVLALAIVPTLASAATLTFDTAFNSNFGDINPTFGSANQRASNPLHDDGSIVIKATRSLPFKYTGDPLTDPSIDHFSVTFVPDATAQYNLVSTDVNGLNLQPTLPIAPSTAGTPVSINFEGKIPEDLDAVDTAFVEKAFKVGTLTIEGMDGTNLAIPGTTITFSVFMQRENLFRISDADAEVNNKAKENIDDNDEIKDLKPGDQIDLTVEVENNYDNNDDINIDGADLTLDCGNNKNLDIDDENLDIDVSADEKETDTFNINLEEDAKDGSINCEIQTMGIDDNGARMGEKLKFSFDVQRETHDVQIKLPILTTPQAITCDDTSLQMTIGFINLGKSDEDETAIELTNQDLNFQERRSNIQLNEDDSEVEIFDVPLDKLTGKTPIIFSIKTFYDNVKSSDTETLLVDNTCLTSQPKEEDQDQDSQPPVGKGTAILEEGALATKVNKFNSIAVQVTNNENDKTATFEVSLTDVSDFAVPSSAKVVQLQPGQTSTVFLNFKTKQDIEEGTYTGTVSLKSGGQVVDTKLFTVEVSGAEDAVKDSGISFNGTKLFWIIGDIILIVVAIFFIRLIFTAGRRKKGDKKMADYEAAAKQRR